MLLTARTALFIVKSLSACREKLLKQQYLHGNLFVQGNLQRETRELGKTVHTASGVVAIYWLGGHSHILAPPPPGSYARRIVITHDTVKSIVHGGLRG